MTISAEVLEALEARGLDVELADRLGFESVRRDGTEFLSIPCLRDGRIHRRKLRTITGPKRFMQEGEGPIPWNEDVLRDEGLVNQPLIITEGELDAMAAIQCGFARTISVPDGAPQEASKEPFDQKRYAWVAELRPRLSRQLVPEIILATDGDDPGAALRQDLSVILGRFRCKFLSYPYAKDRKRRLKDLNEVLLEYGAKGVVETVGRAQFIQSDGVYRMSDLPELPPSVAYQAGFALLDENYRVRMGDFVVVTGIPSHGKALALDTPVPAPSGWTTMKDLRVGDQVFDENGAPCTVTAATEVQLGRPCYRICFDDGTEVVADADHRWLTLSEKARRSALMTARKRGERTETAPRGTDQRHKRTFASVVTTADIAGSIMSQGKINHHIALCGPIAGNPNVVLPVEPYTLGVWLGDGKTSAATITVGNNDKEEMVAALAAVGQPTTQRRNQTAWTLGLTAGRGGAMSEKLQARLRMIGVLNNKHVPEIYLRAPPEQRLALLQGLMDTDGSAQRDGSCEFCSTNERLARDVYDLAAGLGAKPKFYRGRATIKGRDISEKYRVVWFGALPAFRLARKLAKLPTETPARVRARRIVSCDPVESVPVRCIQVDSPSRLFLCTRAYIPTHNSSFVNDFFCRLATRHGFRVAWASFEQDVQRDHRRALRSWFCERLEKDISAPDLAKADAWIDRHHRFIVPSEDEDVSLEWMLEKLEQAVVQHDCQVVVIDPWNEMDHMRERDETETEYVGRAIKRFKRFAKAFQVHLVVVAHPTKIRKDENGKTPMPTLYDIAGSANWNNKADVGVIVHRETDEDTIIKIAKSRYHSQIGAPGAVMMQFCKDDLHYRETERLS